MKKVTMFLESPAASESVSHANCSFEISTKIFICNDIRGVYGEMLLKMELIFHFFTVAHCSALYLVMFLNLALVSLMSVSSYSSRIHSDILTCD